MRCRKSGIITGLPDAYGRGRVIGDYRRVALYGVDRLLEAKQAERAQVDDMWPTDEVIRVREELAEQIRSLKELKEMARLYGHDISGPANGAREAVQSTYFGYLAAIKQQNGAAMSAGRLSTFWDIYFERDLREGKLTESQAQEIVDDLVISGAWCARAPAYSKLLGRPGMGHGGVGRMGETDAAGDQDIVPNAAHPEQPGAGARAQPHRLLVPAASGGLQTICNQGIDRHKLHPVRVGRPDAAQVGRRLRHRLLRLGDADGQTNAVFWCAREFAQDAAVCPKRGAR
jgi:hypothetical protein